MRQEVDPYSRCSGFHLVPYQFLTPSNEVFDVSQTYIIHQVVFIRSLLTTFPTQKDLVIISRSSQATDYGAIYVLLTYLLPCYLKLLLRRPTRSGWGRCNHGRTLTFFSCITFGSNQCTTSSCTTYWCPSINRCVRWLDSGSCTTFSCNLIRRNAQVLRGAA